MNNTQTAYWIVPLGISVDDFDFTWRPDPHDPPFIHQFGTQWQKTGGPRFVVPGATNIKYVDTLHVEKIAIDDNWRRVRDVKFDLTWHPDANDPPYIHQFYDQFGDLGPRYIVAGATEIKYHSDLVAKKLDMTKWEIPSNLDISGFDFWWQPPEYEDQPYIYQFGTQHQRTGGPRYIVPGATDIKYIDGMVDKALPSMDNWQIPDGISDIDFDFSWHPGHTDLSYRHIFKITSAVTSETVEIVYQLPDAVADKHHTELTGTFKYKILDIVFVSNGETGAEERYQRLCEIAGRAVKRVSGVMGRENALRQAATISETAWFYCFPGKLSVDENFDFDWHPRLLDEPKHYIFYATNPVNGLEYGHMAAVCYNRQLVLETVDYGLDFTMSKLHDIVPITSGIARYNSDRIMTWRTAFREVIKLTANPTEENQVRLETWLSTATGDFAHWSLQGARDGVDYYRQVNGNHKELMRTFHWDWLSEHFEQLYPKLLTTE
jgi:hypothetical protein